MKEYEEMSLKVGDKVGMEINKVDSVVEFEDHLIMLPSFSFCVSQYFSRSIAPSTLTQHYRIHQNMQIANAVGELKTLCD